MDSILESIKKMLGITNEYEHFDSDIIMHINSVLAVLTQIGVGPSEGFSIKDANSVWDDFLPQNESIEFVKTYVYLRVRLLFDPPNSSAVMESMKRSADEFEWRIQVAVDPVENNER